MNRPFGALGTLAAMLALAMLAVSSSSRSTTVGSGPASRLRSGRSYSRGSYLTATERACIPAAAPSAPPLASGRPTCDDERCAESCIDIECDDSPAIDRNHWSCEFAAPRTVTTSPPTPSTTAAADEAAEPPSSSAETGGLKPAQLEAAEPLAALPAAAVRVDCRAGYDPAYDELIYGAPDAGERGSQTVHAEGDWGTLDALEVMELFRSIFRLSGPAAGANASERMSSLRLGEQPAASPVTWSEYGELIDAAVAASETGLPPSAANVLETDVRSGRGLLHSAAAAVSQVEQLLNWAATGIGDTVHP